MKALRQIIIMAAAALVMASCDDESMNLDKTVVGVVSGNVKVEVRDSSYQLSWELPEIYTSKGTRVLAGNPEQVSVPFDVYLAPAYNDDTLVFIKTVVGCEAELSFSEVEVALGEFSSYVQDYRFGVNLSGADLPKDNKVCYSAVQMVNNNTIDKRFETFNHWFTERKKNTGNDVVENDYIAKIESKSNSNYWDVQFCNVFHGLDNQKTKGKKFKLSFKVMWDGKGSNPAYFTIYTGKYFYKKETKSYSQNSDDQWNLGYNTQLTFENGWGDMFNTYEAKSGWTTATFNGTIGELGTDIIAIQINLSGSETKKYLNPDGTFYFKNMVVTIGDEVVAKYFMEENARDINVTVGVAGSGSGKVEGGGTYKEGQEVELTATPDDGSVFYSWSDGSIENPRELLVDGDIDIKAVFAKPDKIIPKKYPGDNQWFYYNINNNSLIAYTIEDETSINIEGVGPEPYYESLICCFQNLDGQNVESNTFQLDFDLMWIGAKENANIRISSQLDKGMFDDSRNSWEELSALNEAPEWEWITIPANSWESVSWGGVINKRGNECIVIGIDFAGRGDQLSEPQKDRFNGPGTFRIKEMRVLINNEQVWPI